METEFRFDISLSVLNHLGRNLYRSFATVLGEAISNSWDADAQNIHIDIDRKQNRFVIRDDGIGMTAVDFQNKFLKIGYSKRDSGLSRSEKGRPFIGRKGIGKLALLSCAARITVISKVAGGEYVGGTIDNSILDDAIEKGLTSLEYHLEPLNMENAPQSSDGKDHGTMIIFEDINDGIKSSLDLLKKITALYFRFSLHEPSFNIYINDDKITLDHLEYLAEKTEFLWNINNLKDPYISTNLANHLKAPVENIDMEGSVQGFIASVNKPRDLKIPNTDVRASIDLFVNGRLRETDILKHIPTSRMAENYFYGQIHFDKLDDEKDRFTSSREGVISDDPKYQKFLEALRKKVGVIMERWDELRRDRMEDGDSENDSITRQTRKAGEFFNAVIKEYQPPEDSEDQNKVEGWKRDLKNAAEYNFASYAHCFISENLLRQYIEDNGSAPTSCTNIDQNGKTCRNRPDSKESTAKRTNKGCEYCKGEMRKESLKDQKQRAQTSIKIRVDEDNILMYLDYIDLVEIIKNDMPTPKQQPYKNLIEESKPYQPLRNSVMHTSCLTEVGKRKLATVTDSVVATVKTIISGS